METWELCKGKIEGDRIACCSCGKPLSDLHHSTRATLDDGSSYRYALCVWCGAKVILQ